MAYKAMNDLVHIYLSGLIVHHLPQNIHSTLQKVKLLSIPSMPLISDPLNMFFTLSRTPFNALNVWLTPIILYVSV